MNDEQRLQQITEMLLLVRDNLFKGMSKSFQRMQAEAINEVLGLPKYIKNRKEMMELTNEPRTISSPS